MATHGCGTTGPEGIGIPVGDLLGVFEHRRRGWKRRGQDYRHRDVRRIGQKPVAGQGHIQIYLDKIPASAYTKGSSQDLVVVIGSPSFRFQVSKQWTKRASR